MYNLPSSPDQVCQQLGDINSLLTPRAVARALKHVAERRILQLILSDASKKPYETPKGGMGVLRVVLEHAVTDASSGRSLLSGT